MGSSSEIVEVHVDIDNETDGAFLVNDGDGHSGWIGKSLISNYLDNREDFGIGAYVTMEIPLWKAEELELV